MPLDAATLDISPDLRQPLNLTPKKSGLADALSASVQQQLPGAIQQSMTDAEARSKSAEQGVKELGDLRQKYDTLQAPVPPPPSKPPETPHTDPVSAWGSLAMAAAMLGSAFTKQPFMNSLNAAAAVMNAYKKNDADAYKIAFDKWKAESDYGIKLYEYQRDVYKDAIDKIKDEKTFSEGMAKLRIQTAATGDDKLNAIAKAGNGAAAIQTYEMHNQTIEKYNQAAPIAAAVGEARLEALHAVGDRERAIQAGDKQVAEAADQRIRSAEQKIKVLTQGGTSASTADARLQQENDLFERLKKEWPDKNPGKTYDATVEAQLRAQAHGAVAGRGQTQMEPTLSEESQTRLADQFLAGQGNVLAGLGYGNAGAANRAAVQNKISERAKALAEEIGVPEGKIGEFLAIKHAEYAGITAGERTLGVRTAQLGLAVHEAELLMPAVLKASEAVPRTELTDLNKLIIAGDTHTGDPNTVRLGIAMNSFINVYARAISPTGTPTVSDKDHARDLMAPFWSKGQVKAGLDQLNIELQAAMGAPSRVRQEFREGAGNKVAPSPSDPAAATASQPAAATNLPTDLPPAAGHPAGTTIKQGGKVIAVIRNGQWVAP